MSLPDFLCIGAQKAGTSWLFSQLRSHPGVWMPPVKELHFFDHLFVPQNRRWTTWHIHQNVKSALRFQLNNNDSVDWQFTKYLIDLGTTELFTETWYRRAFDRPAASGKLLGDVTPEYSTLPEAGLAYVRRLLGAVKIIYIIREPVGRAVSQLRMNVARKASHTLSHDEWREMADHPDIDNRGDYRRYVPRWRARWADEDLLFVPYGRIGADPTGVMRTVEDFLGLSRHEYPRAEDRIHGTKPVEVPPFVVERLQHRLAPQRAFVEDAFDEAFVRDI